MTQNQYGVYNRSKGISVKKVNEIYDTLFNRKFNTNDPYITTQNFDTANNYDALTKICRSLALDNNIEGVKILTQNGTVLIDTTKDSNMNTYQNYINGYSPNQYKLAMRLLEKGNNTGSTHVHARFARENTNYEVAATKTILDTAGKTRGFLEYTTKLQ
jgi:hypothetical protein